MVLIAVKINSFALRFLHRPVFVCNFLEGGIGQVEVINCEELKFHLQLFCFNRNFAACRAIGFYWL